MKLTLKAIGLAALLVGTSLATQHFIRPALAHGCSDLGDIMMKPEPEARVRPVPLFYCRWDGRAMVCD
jgi:hypothetical protein